MVEPVQGEGQDTRAVGWSVLGQLSGHAALLLSMPFAVARLGPERFGIWTFASTVVALLLTLDGGLSGSLATYFAAHHARNERAAARQLLIRATALTGAAGGLLAGLVALCAPLIVRVVDLPPELGSEAIEAVRLLSVLVFASFLALAPVAVLRGAGRYRSLAAVSGAAAVGFTVTLGIALVRSPSSSGLVLAAVIRTMITCLGAAGLALASTRGEGSAALSAPSLREVLRFGLPLQGAAALGTLGTRADVPIVAALLPVRFVGYYGVGATVAGALRSLFDACSTPHYTSLAQAVGRSGSAAGQTAVVAAQPTWVRGTLLVGGTLGAVAPAGIIVWLGARYTPAAVVASVLVVSVSVIVSLSLVAGLARADGRPSLELRYTLITILVNVLFTIVLTWRIGFAGVVLGTGIGTIVGAVWLERAATRIWPLLRGRLLVSVPLPALGALGTAVVAVTGLGLLIEAPRIAILALLFLLAVPTGLTGTRLLLKPPSLVGG